MLSSQPPGRRLARMPRPMPKLMPSTAEMPARRNVLKNE
jgi:hypothetical protein